MLLLGRRGTEAAARTREATEGVGAREGLYYYAHGHKKTDANFARPKRITAQEAAELEAHIGGGTGGGSKWNSSNYHWEERDHTEWARSRVRELIQAVTVKLRSKCSIRMKEVALDGFATINVRKAKGFRASS